MPSVHHVHPEFGYFCPTPRFRRDVRVAIVSVALGALVGAGYVTLRATHEHETATALTMTPVVQPVTDGAAVIDNGASAIETANKADAVKVDRLRVDLTKADAAKSDTAKSDAAKSETAKSETSKPAAASGESRGAEPGKTDPAKAACENKTWSYIDGTCVANKPRRVIVRAATDRPAVATAPIGRSAAASSAAPAAAAEKQQNPVVASAVAAATPAAPAVTSETAAAASKKPQRAVHSARHRNDGDPRVARERAAAAGARGAPVYASNGGGFFSGGFLGMRWPWQQ
jgi:hypothetical protein